MIWMTQDPETGRIALLDSEPGECNFPAGNRGRGWRTRRGEIDPVTWDNLMAAGYSPDEQDELHRRLWEEATT